jgi:hypothetical protein
VRSDRTRERPATSGHGSSACRSPITEPRAPPAGAPNPIVLGSGKRLFGDSDQPRGLRLIDSQATTTGVVLLTYRPA